MSKLNFKIAKKKVLVNVHKCEFNEAGEVTKIAVATENDFIKSQLNKIIANITPNMIGDLSEEGLRHFAKHQAALLSKFVVTSSNGERMPLEVIEEEL